MVECFGSRSKGIAQLTTTRVRLRLTISDNGTKALLIGLLAERFKSEFSLLTGYKCFENILDEIPIYADRTVEYETSTFLNWFVGNRSVGSGPTSTDVDALPVVDDVIRSITAVGRKVCASKSFSFRYPVALACRGQERIAAALDCRMAEKLSSRSCQLVGGVYKPNGRPQLLLHFTA